MNMPKPSTMTRATRLSVLAAVSALTLASGTASAALEIPAVPLQSGTAVPPNIWYILDDSGSMAWWSMPGTSGYGSFFSLPDNTQWRSSARNTVYYDPSITYRPWRRADGTYMADTPPSAAFSDANEASDPTDLADNNRTFYVLRDGATDLTENASYTRYVLRSGGTSARRCNWTGNDWDCATISAFPWGRTPTQEWNNFANWFSFHGTRMKAAKAGTSYAFAELGADHRVGFTTIWDRNTFDIPVDNEDGRFEGSNRTTWFSRLFGAEGSSVTPLHNALDRAGEYFEGSGSAGPWGPQSAENQLQCRQNFSILTTDGYWNSRDTSFGNVDGTQGPEHSGPFNADYRYQAAAPFDDDHSNTLADVAMNYWSRDLRPDMVNAVPTTPGNPAFWQHMVTFGISIGMRGTLDPEADLPGLTDGSIQWPNPNPTENATRIDDLWHATVNGRGQFIAASDPEAFTEGLRDALAAITERVGSGSNVAANSVALREETRIFQASYVGGRWTGDVASYPITAAGVAADPSWRFSDAGKIPTITTRRLSVFTHGSGQGRNFYDFRRAGLGTQDGFSVLDYLLGDQSGEISNDGPFRERTSLVGDIINSSPAFSRETEPAALFVGANDGMMHAIDAATGEELFAYVPGSLADAKLARLSDPDYVHEYFVDGPIVVSTRTQTPDQNILLGTLGRGGKGLYALDVTEPDSFAAGDVLWDTASTGASWTGDPTADLGLVVNQPIIARTNARTGNQTSAYLPAMAIFGNGLNSTSGRAALYFVDVTTGDVVRQLRLGTQTGNGVTSVRALDEDGDGRIDYVYAADLRGNVWKVDANWHDAARWGVADGSAYGGGGGGNNTNKAAGGNPLIATGRPITGGLQVAFEPNTFERWVFFGTGKYLEQQDVSSTDQERWYGVKDSGESITSIATQLTDRAMIVSTTIDGTPVRGFQPHGPLDTDTLGWYIDLEAPVAPATAPPSERMVSDPLMVGRVLVASSILPSADPCASGGTGYLNAIDAFTGTSVASPFFDVDGDGSFDDDVLPDGDGSVPVGSVNLGIAMPTSPTVVENLLVVGGSLGTTSSVGINNPLLKGRISWREILGD